MRVAILISGDPRFCQEFDIFVEKLKGYDQVDWFFYIWKNSPETNNFSGGTGHQVVSPFWQTATHDEAISRLKEYLPEKHIVAGFCLADQKSVIMHEILDNYAAETNQSNVWKMWYSQYRANQMRVEYEQGLEFKYDLIIRARPDLVVYEDLDLYVIKNKLDENPDVIVMPLNGHCGYDGVWVCDLLGIGTSETMTIYTDLYNQALDHHRKGVKFHPETMLGRHLEYNNLKYGKMFFNVDIRQSGDWKNNDTGVIYTTAQLVNQRLDFKDYTYMSDFGKWN